MVRLIQAVDEVGDRAIHWLGEQPRNCVLAVALGAIAAIAAVDYFVDYQNVSIAFFYVVPITAVAGRLGLKAGMLTALAALALWQWCDLATRTYESPLIPLWNSCSRLFTLSLVVMLVSSLRSAHARERRLARTDKLTGALNRLHFVEELETELELSRRYNRPLTIAFIDVDRLSLVNNRYGHLLGDDFLKQTVSCIRRTDTVARWGGDEFIVLFPNTTAEQAAPAIARIQANLDEMTQSFDFDFPAGHSIGWVTYTTPPDTVDEAIEQADRRMYAVKNSRRLR